MTQMPRLVPTSAGRVRGRHGGMRGSHGDESLMNLRRLIPAAPAHPAARLRRALVVTFAPVQRQTLAKNTKKNLRESA